VHGEGGNTGATFLGQSELSVVINICGTLGCEQGKIEIEIKTEA